MIRWHCTARRTVGWVAASALAAVLGTGIPAEAQSPLALDVPAPKLVGAARDWLNTDGKPLTFQRGKVYVVEFWTFG